MNKHLKVATALFYAAATILIAQAIYRHTDRSWLAIGHAVTVWLVSVVLPARWTALLVRTLRERDVVVGDLEFLIVMPSWCAGLAAVMALQFLRG